MKKIDKFYPVEQVKQYYEWFSEEEYQRRYKKVREAMSQRGLDCLIVYGSGIRMRAGFSNVCYLSNWVGEVYAYVVFPMEGEPTLIAPAIFGHIVDVMTLSVIKDVRFKGDKNMPDFAPAVAERIKELKLEEGNIGIVGPGGIGNITIPVSHYFTLKEKLPKAHFEFVKGMFERIRRIHSPEVMKCIEKGAELTDLALEALIKAVKPGATDLELSAAAAHACRQRGGRNVIELVGSHPMSGEWCCPNPWWYPPSRPIKKGDIVVTEISEAWRGYAGQLCHSIALGEPPKDYRDMFEIALEVYKRVQKALKPGNTEEDVLKASEPLTEAGFFSMTPIIHGWGFDLDRPFVGTSTLPGYRTQTFTVFEKGMTIMIEPAPTTPDFKKSLIFGGLNLVTEVGGKGLQKHPLEFTVV